MHKTAVFSAVATGFAVCLRQKGVEFFFWVCYNVGNQSQGSYIGNTTASQAVKAGSIPVPCSKKEDANRRPLFWSRRESNPCKCNSPVDGCLRPAGRAQHHNFRQRRKCKSIPVPCIRCSTNWDLSSCCVVALARKRPRLLPGRSCHWNWLSKVNSGD